MRIALGQQVVIANLAHSTVGISTEMVDAGQDAE